MTTLTFDQAHEIFCQTDENSSGLQNAFFIARRLAKTFNDWLQVFDANHQVPHDVVADYQNMVRTAQTAEDYFGLLDILASLLKKNCDDNRLQPYLNQRRIWLDQALAEPLGPPNPYPRLKQLFEGDAEAQELVIAKAADYAPTLEEIKREHDAKLQQEIDAKTRL